MNDLKRDTPSDTLNAVLRAAREWNASNPWANSSELRDRLRANAGAWKAYGADRTVLSWILFGAELPHIWKPQQLQFANHRSAQEHAQFVTDEIAAGVADGTYRIVARADVKCVNPISVVRNPNSGKLRMCIDARWPNAHGPEVDFALPTIERDLADTVFANDKMISADITKAYHAIPITERAMQYLAVEWKGQIVVPTVLPFGSALAPFIFNKTARQVVRAIRLTGQRVLQFYDDWLFAAPESEEELMVRTARELLHTTGWRTNAKCVWKPALTAQFLGFLIDAQRFTVSVTQKRVDRAVKLLEALRAAARAMEANVPLDELESFVGMVVAMRPAIAHATLFARDMMFAAQRARDSGATHADATTDLKAELNFWSDELKHPPRSPIVGPGAVITVHCDAGETAAGAVLSTGVTLSEPLPTELIGQSSTARELFAVLRVLEVHGDALRGRVIRLYLDSFAAIRNLLKGGGPVPRLVRFCKAIHALASARAITLQPTWIPRDMNAEADSLSKPWDPQPQLTPRARERIAQLIGSAELRGWSTVAVFAPAPNNLGFAVQRLRAERAKALLVAPVWPGQTWFQNLQHAKRAAWDLGSANDVWERKSEQMPYPNWSISLFAADFGAALTTAPYADAPSTGNNDRRECASPANDAVRARRSAAAEAVRAGRGSGAIPGSADVPAKTESRPAAAERHTDTGRVGAPRDSGSKSQSCT